ncbi:hypothetical protein D3C71_1929220 [compost metagenome]
MKGTTISATRAIWRMPPKMTMPEMVATAIPTAILGTPNAPWTASAMELACTALKTRPKERIRQTEKIVAAQGALRPRAM